VVYVSPLSNRLIENLEAEVPKFDAQVVEGFDQIQVLVLGAGYTNDPDISKTSQLSGTVALRLIEALSIYQVHQKVTLITSGAKLDRSKSQAEAVADAAVALGVSPADTAYLGNTINTEHEARMFVKRFGTEVPTVVVSSARHAKRTLFWFRHFGVKTVYFAPCDYLYKQDPAKPDFLWKPSLNKAAILQKYWHESVGMWYGRLKTLR
jgi:uncharacterized SAM-binding protein YcdF (DUF218 family)